MKKYILAIIVIIGVITIIFISSRLQNRAAQGGKKVKLPEPRRRSDISLEETVANRRSRRQFKDVSLDSQQLSQLLWAAQGITDQQENFRAAPSAGALYPLETFAVVSNVEDLDPGVYRYLPEKHAVKKTMAGDLSSRLQSEALDQKAVGAAPLNIVLTAIYKRSTSRYGERAHRYAHIETGHVDQNIYLQAEALKLGTVAIGAFSDEGVSKVLRLEEEKPLLILPVGKPQ
ncbi:MAG: SagB/ThcOx family dehydrogenase [bacterium]